MRLKGIAEIYKKKKKNGQSAANSEGYNMNARGEANQCAQWVIHGFN